MFFYILTTSRPSQWLKNFVVFIPVLFSFNESWVFNGLDSLGALFLNATLAFLAFTFITIAIYFVNDILDKDNDRKHPIKKARPISSGELAIRKAIYVSVSCIFIAFAISLMVNLDLALAIFSYLVLMLFYSYFLKEIIFLDVISIALGFIIRVIAGALAISVPISSWICICMLFGALFIAFSKRLSEIWNNGDGASLQRPVLRTYSRLNKNISIFGVSIIMLATIISYSLYTIFATNLPMNNSMLLTVPFVCVGMVRYFYIVVKFNLGERPEIIIVKDHVMRTVIITWIGVVALILYLWR